MPKNSVTLKNVKANNSIELLSYQNKEIAFNL